jgi:hypothetical protein
MHSLSQQSKPPQNAQYIVSDKELQGFNQLGGYDILTHHALLCIIVSMTSLHVTHVSNYTIVRRLFRIQGVAIKKPDYF